MASLSSITDNIYHMLSYIYPPLQGRNYTRPMEGRVDNAASLMAALMAAGVSAQLKHGLHRQYSPHVGELDTVRGRIDMRGTMALGYRRSNSVFCEYDELTEDNPTNRVIKAAMDMLLSDECVQAEYHRGIKRLLPYFAEVGQPDLRQGVEPGRLGANQAALLGMGLLALKHMEPGGGAELGGAGMQKVFSGYVLNYYKRHHRVYVPENKQVKWDADHIDMLPAMRGNILLRHMGRTLLIDPLYYGRETLRSRGGRAGMHGDNIYRLFTRVKNLNKTEGEVRGLLLYGRSEGEPIPDAEYNMGGNQVIVRSVDMRNAFRRMCRQLDVYTQYIKDEKNIFIDM